MKHLFGLLVLFSVIMTFGQTKRNSLNGLIPGKIDSTEYKKILQIEEQFRKAKIERDVKFVDKILSENYIGSNQNGNTKNKAQTKELWTTFQIHSLTLDSIKVDVKDSLAYVKGQQTEDGQIVEFSHVFSKQKGSWLLSNSIQINSPKIKTQVNGVSINDEPIVNVVTAPRIVKEGQRLSPEQVTQLEDKLKINPENLSARTRLLGYYFSSSLNYIGPEASQAARRRHIIWLIQNHPENPVNKLSETTIDSVGHNLADAEGYIQAKKLWLEQIELKKDNPYVLMNAAWFFKLNNKSVAIKCLKQAIQLAPRNNNITAQLGYTYGLTILGITMINNNGIPMGQNPALVTSSDALSAINDLRTTNNLDVITVATNFLSQFGPSNASLSPNAIYQDELTEELIIRAVNLDPNYIGSLQILIQFYSQRSIVSKIPEEKIKLANKALEQVDKFIKLSKNHGEDYIYTLSDASKLAMVTGSFKKAKLYASEVLSLIPDPPVFNNGGYFHDGHLILGRIALQDGNKKQAMKHLLQAGHTPGSGVLSSFGPNMTLAKELSDIGERETVIEYLELCKSFWKSKNDIYLWQKTLREGKTPDFGANLVY